MLLASNLVKRFAGVTAVNDVSLQVRPGTVLGLLGPNGAGKTTTIRMLLNIIKPDTGTITLNDAPITEETKNHVGYLPEERGLYRKGNVLETILFFAALKGMTSDSARRAALQWLQRFDLANAGKRRIEELSKGNQQKIQFIISVIHNPDILVLDEPFSGLDPLNQEVLKEIILEERAANKGIIFSTHQMDQAEQLCDDLCLIDRGTVVLKGTLGEVRRQFGHKILHLEYDGDGSFLKALPTVTHASVLNDSADLQIERGASVSAVVRSAADRLELRAIETREPSLHSIFLDVVGRVSSSEPISP